MTKLVNTGKLLGLALIFILLLNGCATIFHGTTDEVIVTSQPQNTKVYINGIMVGNTPLKMKLDSDRSYAVEFKKDGYESRTTMITSSVSGGYVVLDVLCGVWPIVIDAATGAWSSLDQDQVSVVLDKK